MMKQINHITTKQGVDILTTEYLSHYNDPSKVYIKNFIDNTLNKGSYTFIDLYAVSTSDFVRFAQNCIQTIKENALPLENIILFSPYESYSYRYYNFMFSVFALNGTKNILLLDAGIGKNDKFIENCFDDLTVTQKYFSYFTNFYFDNPYHMPDQDISLIEKNKYFCSLARWPRYERIKFTNKLLSNSELFKKGLVSCAWDPYNKDTNRWEIATHSQISQLIPAHLRNYYPVLLDDSKPNQYDIEHRMAECAIHVLLEGDVGINTNCYSFRNNTSASILNELSDRSTINEKTVKMLLSFQLPLFVAMPGYVQDLRLLGFDLFDDFVNHSYDKIDDLDIRLNQVFTELERLCNLEFHDICEYIETNKNRMHRNIGKLQEFSHSCILDIQDHIKNNFS